MRKFMRKHPLVATLAISVAQGLAVLLAILIVAAFYELSLR
jgi:hypothetical protein